jgi:conjugal transfer pilus assembly protein TraI
MKSLFALLFGASRAPAPVPAPPDEDIPRYPPFAQGLPAAPVGRILATQAELIDALRHTLALPDKDYRAILAPVLERYAAFTHLLPASEAHHHRGAGGLFRHGLEVAHWAALASEGTLFGLGATPRERKDQEPRWRLAVGLAGLLHDIGKPVSDLSIVDRSGTAQWNPYLENLTDWAGQHGVDHYFLRWRDKRHQRHEQFSVLVSERVLTPACLSYLTAAGPEILQAMLEAIAGVDRGGVLAGLVLDADRKSVERDLRAHHLPGEASLGVPVEKYLLDAMRRLVREERWTVNQPGARVWRFREGLHVVWKAAAGDIGDLLARDRVPGIPRDPDTLADILLERGLAIPRDLPDGRTYRYWRMVPAALDLPLYLLRLAAPELIFSGEPPLVVAGRLLDDAETGESPSSPADEVQAAGENPARSTVLGTALPLPAEPVARQPVASHGKSRSKAGKTKEPDTSDPTPPPEIPRQEEAVLPSPTEVADTTPAHQPHPAAESAALVDENAPAPPVRDPARDEAEAWLAAQGQAGEWLSAILRRAGSGQGPGLVMADGRVFLSRPATAQSLDVEPREFLGVLDQAGWIETEVLAPLRKIRDIGGQRGVVLIVEVSRRILALARDARPGTAAATSAGTVSPEDSGAVPGSADALIALIRSGRELPFPVTREEGWLVVPDAILDWYVQAHQGLSRARLVVELHRHPDCRMEGKPSLRVRPAPREAEP